MGYTAVAPGQLITAAHTNLIMGQSVMRFTNEAQRTSQLPSPSEGMLSWLADVDWLMVYRAGAWRVGQTMRMGYGMFGAATVPTATDYRPGMATFGAPANTAGRGTFNANGSVRVPTAGMYLVSGHVTWPSNSTGERKTFLQRSSDGTTWNRTGVLGAIEETNSAGTSQVAQSIGGQVYLAANDYCALWVYQTSGVGLAFPNNHGGLTVALLGGD